MKVAYYYDLGNTLNTDPEGNLVVLCEKDLVTESIREGASFQFAGEEKIPETICCCVCGKWNGSKFSVIL